MPERVLAQLPQGVVLVDPELVIEYANPAAERLLGAGSGGDPLPDPWPDFSLRELATALFGSDPPPRGRLVETDRHFYWVEGLPPSTAETAILIVEDVTERERARQSEREFVENAAHELRTPLAAIVSVMDVLESGAKDIPEARDRFLNHIRVHSERLSRLARSLLVLARLQTGAEQPRLTVVQVRPLLEEIAGRLDPADGVEVSVRSSAAIGALADRELLERAIRSLIVGDEPAIAEAVEYALKAEGFDVETVDDGNAALEQARAKAYDLLVLDLMLPGLSGVEVCRRLRDDSPVPILMLTAKDGEVDRVLGLEVGADDYVAKPFSMPELVARVRALLRRRKLDSGERTTKLRVGELELDLAKHEARLADEHVPLTAFELKLLALLAAEPGHVFSRREIMAHLWNSSYVGDERACDLHVSNIRRKIERDPAPPEKLLTGRGRGYKPQPF